MDIKAYISSGILENYVLGLINQNERWEVEKHVLEYPEIRAELNRIEEAIESYAKSKSITPPEGLLNIIMSEVKEEDNPPDASTTSSDIVIPPKGNSKWWVLATLLASLLSLFLLWKFFQQQNELKENKLQNELLQEECDSTENELLDRINILRNTGGLIIAMGGTDKAPDAETKVYWNENSKTAYLDVVNLPTPPSGKQYQLWAIVEGAPVDMGVFDVSSTDTLVPAPFIENPAAFAITLENEGGSPTPTLDEMVVIGEV